MPTGVETATAGWKYPGRKKSYCNQFVISSGYTALISSKIYSAVLNSSITKFL